MGAASTAKETGMSTKLDIHQEITNRIVDAIESAGDFKLPWITSQSVKLSRPVNIASGKGYNGINILSLWVSAVNAQYASNVWGTYRQWQERGRQVRKGEKSSLVVFYKTIDITVPETESSSDEEAGQLRFARASHVFNEAQLDFVMEPENLPGAPAFDPLESAEAFACATGAVIEETGGSACFIPSADKILMPERRRFIGTETLSAGEAYYATLFHELVHNAVTRIMPHGVRKRLISLASAMRQFGIIRALQGTRGVGRPV